MQPVHPLRVIRHSAVNAFADMRAVYTWKTWTFGWLGRMLAQVTFFVLLGRLVGGPDQARYLIVGNALMTCVIESLTVVASSTWERAAGTLPLLAAAPAKPTWVFLGRSLQWPISGTGTSLVALFVLGPAFGVSWTAAQVPVAVVLVVLTAVGTYFLGLFLAALVLNAGSVRNVVSNAGYLLMMAVCGVQVPVGYWPEWVGWIARAIPLTHLLGALRSLTDGADLATVSGEAAVGLLVGLAWLGAAHLMFEALLRRGRRAGTIDFAS
ncbi:ABC transporter permease [Streptomyces sp. NBC_00091]|uniref:ABC transporter permease n=1 Tax=Streptomyces sp. NBC_00091 TaxID=2975648 RepID=UPI00225127BA|nr:ABC transporter permease [Streptomyces sp. NBC_00091]MCX5379754.1 ABC transporter permease [Streptomyces sp. NBC_00091]